MALALAAGLAATRDGIGISRDSAVYLGSAERLAEGDGLRVPFRPYPLSPTPDPLATSERLENFPPLYPATLAALSRITGIEARPVARALNAVLLAALVLLVAAIVYVASGRRLALSLLIALLTLLSIDVLITASMLWTELLFTLLSVVALVLVAMHVERPRWATLVVCAAVVALAFLTRLAGAALVLGVASSLLLLSRRPWTARLRDAAVVVAAAGLPVVAWMAVTSAGADRVANRELALHPPGAAALGGATETVVSWVLPSRVAGRDGQGPAGQVIATVAKLPALLRGFIVVAALTALVILARRRRGPDVSASPPLNLLPPVLLLFLGSYALFLLVSSALFDAALARFDHRILMPAHVVALVAAGVLVAQRVDVNRFWRPASVVVAPLVLLLAVDAVVALVDGRQFGGVFASPRWRTSPIMAAVRDLPSDRIVVTNEPGAVWAITGRPAAAVPEQKSVVTLKANSHLHADLVALGRAMHRRGAALVYVDGAGESSFAADEATLTASLPLKLVRHAADGRIYEITCPAEATSSPERDVC
ncbi:MAG: hypothetical protein M3179_07550 [Actinomycetota bacterium]|nr:hypothetical protein [Actinomycetota bacterium]